MSLRSVTLKKNNNFMHRKKIGTILCLLGGMMIGCGDDKQSVSETLSSAPTEQPRQSPSAPKQIDWTLLQTGITPIRPSDYSYPFAEDSTAVKNYAQAYQITPKQAQHSMTVAMASPEALGKILDQLTAGQYLGHYLTDGAKVRLVVVVADEVAAGEFDYVFADSFGQGLILPISIIPKSKAENFLDKSGVSN